MSIFFFLCEIVKKLIGLSLIGVVFYGIWLMVVAQVGIVMAIHTFVISFILVAVIVCGVFFLI